MYVIGPKTQTVVASSIMVLVGESASVGELDDAFKAHAVTTSKDSNIADVASGTVTAKANGTTTIESSITTVVGGRATTNTSETNVVVYDVIPNSDSALDKAANDSAKQLVKEFVNNGKADGLVEISKDSLKNVLNEGNAVKTEVILKEVEAKDILDDALAIDNLIGKEAKASRYYGIEVQLKYGEEVVAKLTKLPTPITITLNIPSNIEEVEDGYVREYSVVRVHDGKAEIIESTFDETVQTLTVNADRFSTYAVTYKDVKQEEATNATGEEANVSEDSISVEEEPRTIYNPKTGDVIACMVALLTFAGAGFMLSKLNKAKNNLK